MRLAIVPDGIEAAPWRHRNFPERLPDQEVPLPYASAHVVNQEHFDHAGGLMAEVSVTYRSPVRVRIGWITFGYYKATSGLFVNRTTWLLLEHADQPLGDEVTPLPDG